jgi:uncharacterized protein
MPALAIGLDVPPKPIRPVLDDAGVLSPAAQGAIVDSILRFERASSNQIAVAIFPSLEGESLEDFTIRLAEAWRPGQAERDNGVILAIFVSDRKVRIEVGYGLEGALPDAVARRIIRNEITPAFRAGDYDRGVTAAVSAIMAATRGEYEGIDRRDDGEPPSIVFILFAFLFFMLPILHRRASGGRNLTGRGVLLGGPLFGDGSGQSGRSGGSGDSFGGFGGGSFGGGGASGGW